MTEHTRHDEIMLLFSQIHELQEQVAARYDRIRQLQDAEKKEAAPSASEGPPSGDPGPST